MAFHLQKWNENACTTRCLFELVHRTQRRVIDPEQFVHEHLAKYPAWALAPGANNTLVTCELIRELGLANVIRTYADPFKVIKESKVGDYVGTLLFTERIVNKDDPERLDLSYHCVLVNEFDTKFFKVWNPQADGTVQENVAWSWLAWHRLMVHAMVLSRVQGA